MILQPKSQEIFDYLRSNGKTSMEKLVEATGRSPRSISGSLTALSNQKLVIREKTEDMVYAELTEAGYSFVPSED